MRVLHLVDPTTGAGSTTSTLHLCAGLAKRGASVGLAGPPGLGLEAFAADKGFAFHPLVLHPGRGLRNAHAVAGLLAASPADIVNTQTASDREAVTWLRLTGRLRVPAVTTHRIMPDMWWPRGCIEGWAATRVVAVSPSVAAALGARGVPAGKLTVIPNGVVTERLDREVTAAELDRWRVRIGWDAEHRTIGMLARRKEQEVLLRALDYVQPPVRLVLAGMDTDDSLVALAARVPARHAVVLLPFDSQIRPLYDLLEVVLLASRSEGLPQGLLEAMALGKPVIASATSGNRDLVTHEENGLLVPGRDVSAWGRALAAVLVSPELARRLGAAARRTARERFSLERTIDLTLRLYSEITSLRA